MGSSKSTIVTATAVWSLINAIFSLCGSLALLGVGAIAGSFGQLASQEGVDLTTEQQQAIAAVSGVGGVLVTILGVVTLVVAIALLVNAIGLFQTKPWSWRLTLVLFGISVVLSVLGWLNNGFTAISLVFTVLNAVIVYLFWTNAEVKQTLGQM
ncbi:MAG: DUF2127 domain-containing protein [Anaerolineae bacterium]|nr:DUF2127 domain-containing protein [Anaerolineae bacterium]